MAQKSVCSKTQSKAPRISGEQIEGVAEDVAFMADFGHTIGGFDGGGRDVEADDLAGGSGRESAHVMAKSTAGNQNATADRFGSEEIDEARAGRAFFPKGCLFADSVIPNRWT